MRNSVSEGSDGADSGGHYIIIKSLCHHHQEYECS